MQSRTRTLLFIVIVVLFVVIAPLLILYAKGYNFNTDRYEVVRTGIIFIDTNVPKVTVTIDGGEPFTENDPVILRGLEAGSYHVTLERKGYESWEADLPVQIEKVTRVDNLLLTLSDPEVQQPIENTVGEFAVSPNSRFIVFAVTAGKDTGIWMHTSGDDQNRQLVELEDLDPNNVREIRWSQNSRLLLLRDKDGNYFTVAPHLATPVLTAIPSLKGMLSEQVRMDNDEPTIVYYTDSKQTLFRLRTSQATAKPEQLATNVQNFAVETPKVFTLQPSKVSGELELLSYDMRETDPAATTIATVPSSTAGRIITEGASLVSVLADNTLYLLSREDGAFEFTQIATDVSDAIWSPERTLLMYKKGLELWAHDLEPLAAEPTDFIFASLSQEPTKLKWHPDGHYVVVYNGDADSQSIALAHATRQGAQIHSLGTISAISLPQFARGGLDLVYKTKTPKPGIAIMTIAEELD